MDNKQYTGIILAAVMVASVFAMFVPVSADPWSPTGNESTEQTRLTEGTLSDEALGGNITNMSISGDILTSKWHGYYGNVTGEIVLESAVDTAMIKWDWTASEGGEVLLTTNTTPSWSSDFVAASGLNVDTAWDYTTGDTDSAANTFDDGVESIKIAGDTVTETARAWTYNNTEGVNTFKTVVVKGLNGSADYKDNYLFAGVLNANKTAYNGETADYQMIVPTPEDGTTDLYYFFMEIA